MLTLVVCPLSSTVYHKYGIRGSQGGVQAEACPDFQCFKLFSSSGETGYSNFELCSDTDCVQKIPNFSLAAPMLIISAAACAEYFSTDWSQHWLGLRNPDQSATKGMSPTVLV